MVCCSGQAGKGKIVRQISYNLGRLTAYAILGAFAGTLGSGLDDLSLILGLQKLSTLVFGLLLIFWGLKSLFHPSSGSGSTKGRLSGIALPFVSKIYTSLLKSTGGSSSWIFRSFLVGAMSGLLPCGWLYAFVAVAAMSGGALQGALVMSAFWVGGVPALVGVAGLSSILGNSLQKLIPKASGAIMIIAGLIALVSRNPFVPFNGHHHGHMHSLHIMDESGSDVLEKRPHHLHEY